MKKSEKTKGIKNSSFVYLMFISLKFYIFLPRYHKQVHKFFLALNDCLGNFIDSGLSDKCLICIIYSQKM